MEEIKVLYGRPDELLTPESAAVNIIGLPNIEVTPENRESSLDIIVKKLREEGFFDEVRKLAFPNDSFDASKDK